ncbi:hypothetical protein P43SY_002405 [Pythium insidiosum]|uniref:Uncharacterized protein n=1 Tax=Pythium insidiosum TaxID=114742 RepID=A0AAD5M198_PYTIN|nr:hypothetical protein P43SY_002405 [Pythium insidiosum]
MLQDGEMRRIEKLGQTLRDLDEVTKVLQDPMLSLHDVRVLFDAVIKQYPCMESRLDARAPIVNNTALETGLVKIIRGKKLAAPELVECEAFRQPRDESDGRSEDARDVLSLRQKGK